MKKYRAFLTQNGNAAPIATVLESTGFLIAPTFERIGEGQYRINAEDQFDGPVFVMIGNYKNESGTNAAWYLNCGKVDEDYCALGQYAFVVDELITGDGFACSIEITVY